MALCTARVLVFSGRPDPVWHLEEYQAQQIEDIWTQLKVIDSPISTGSKLGYRGVSLECAGQKEYLAYDGYVKMQVGIINEWRRDEDRDFERNLLSTAPPNLLPDGIINV